MKGVDIVTVRAISHSDRLRLFGVVATLCAIWLLLFSQYIRLSWFTMKVEAIGKKSFYTLMKPYATQTG